MNAFAAVFIFLAHCVWECSSPSKSRTVIRQKPGSKEHHISIVKVWKAELVRTYERKKTWHSPITLLFSMTRAVQPCVTTAVSFCCYCLWLNGSWNRKVISLQQGPWDLITVDDCDCWVGCIALSRLTKMKLFRSAKWQEMRENKHASQITHNNPCVLSTVKD